MVGLMIVAPAGGVASGSAERTTPVGLAKLLAASGQQQRAIQTLAPGVALNARRYEAALGHVNAAIADLNALARSLAAAARQNGPPPQSGRIDRLLNSAYAGDNHASVQLGGALWLLSKQAPITDTYARVARTELQAASLATLSLARLLR